MTKYRFSELKIKKRIDEDRDGSSKLFSWLDECTVWHHNWTSMLEQHKQTVEQDNINSLIV